MGTKIEYAINVVAPSSNNVHFVEDLQLQSRGRGLNINFKLSPQTSTIMTDNQNLDFIRKSMQIHDDIFKHQVRELHRLYNVQKMLMEELRKEIKQNNHLYSCFNFENLSPRERSGSCSDENTIKIAKGFDLERPAEEDISTSISMIDNNIPYEDTEIELTLSIGGTRSKKKASPANKETGFSPVEQGGGGECSGPTTPISSSSTGTFDHERKQPHWLFQGLSINRTS